MKQTKILLLILLLISQNLYSQSKRPKKLKKSKKLQKLWEKEEEIIQRQINRAQAIMDENQKIRGVITGVSKREKSNSLYLPVQSQKDSKQITTNKKPDPLYLPVHSQEEYKQITKGMIAFYLQEYNKKYPDEKLTFKEVLGRLKKISSSIDSYIDKDKLAEDFSETVKEELFFDGLSQGRLKYNSAYTNPLEVIFKRRGDCSSYTMLHVLFERMRQEKHYSPNLSLLQMEKNKETRPVVIQAHGHILYGYIQKTKEGEYELFGNEATTLGAGKVNFGKMSEIHKKKPPIIPIPLEYYTPAKFSDDPGHYFFASFEDLHRNYNVNINAYFSINASTGGTSTSYGQSTGNTGVQIPNRLQGLMKELLGGANQFQGKKINNLMPGNQKKLNSSPWSYASANVPPGDREMSFSMNVSSEDYQNNRIQTNFVNPEQRLWQMTAAESHLLERNQGRHSFRNTKRNGFDNPYKEFPKLLPRDKYSRNKAFDRSEIISKMNLCFNQKTDKDQQLFTYSDLKTPLHKLFQYYSSDPRELNDVFFETIDRSIPLFKILAVSVDCPSVKNMLRIQDKSESFPYANNNYPLDYLALDCSREHINQDKEIASERIIKSTLEYYKLADPSFHKNLITQNPKFLLNIVDGFFCKSDNRAKINECRPDNHLASYQTIIQQIVEIQDHGQFFAEEKPFSLIDRIIRRGDNSNCQSRVWFNINFLLNTISEAKGFDPCISMSMDQEKYKLKNENNKCLSNELNNKFTCRKKNSSTIAYNDVLKRNNEPSSLTKELRDRLAKDPVSIFRHGKISDIEKLLKNSPNLVDDRFYDEFSEDIPSILSKNTNLIPGDLINLMEEFPKLKDHLYHLDLGKVCGENKIELANYIFKYLNENYSSKVKQNNGNSYVETNFLLDKYELTKCMNLMLNPDKAFDKRILLYKQLKKSLDLMKDAEFISRPYTDNDLVEKDYQEGRNPGFFSPSFYFNEVIGAKIGARGDEEFYSKIEKDLSVDDKKKVFALAASNLPQIDFSNYLIGAQLGKKLEKDELNQIFKESFSNFLLHFGQFEDEEDLELVFNDKSCPNNTDPNVQCPSIIGKVNELTNYFKGQGVEVQKKLIELMENVDFELGSIRLNALKKFFNKHLGINIQKNFVSPARLLLDYHYFIESPEQITRGYCSGFIDHIQSNIDYTDYISITPHHIIKILSKCKSLSLEAWGKVQQILESLETNLYNQTLKQCIEVNSSLKETRESNSPILVTDGEDECVERAENETDVFKKIAHNL